MNRKIKGFTMIELLIVIVIIGIVAAIGYPSYLASIQKSRRAEATIALQAMAQAQERFFSRFRTYTSVVAGPDGCGGQACGLDLASASSENDYYALTSNGNGTGFTVTATATNQQLDDEDCRTFTLNNVNVNTAASSGGADNTHECW